MASCSANLILFDTDLVVDSATLATITDGNNETNSVVVKIILDDIEDGLRVVKLETLPPARTDSASKDGFSSRNRNADYVLLVPTYVKSLADLLMDSSLNEEAFESMIVQLKMKYLK